MLDLIKSHLGNKGNILKQGKDSVQYRIGSLRDISNVIIPHLDKYPLITQKKADFILFFFFFFIFILKRKKIVFFFLFFPFLR
jgi:hypothetical protein